MYDVAIIGGGLAGLSLASLLGQKGASVVCLEDMDPTRPRPQDLRTTAITAGSQKVLHDAGVWKSLLPLGCPILGIDVLDGRSPVLLDFTCDRSQGVDAFGWILDNQDLRFTLQKHVAQLKKVKIMAPATAQDFSVMSDHVVITVKDHAPLRARLVIGADGRRSFVRRWMDVPERHWDYGQRAVLCIAAHSRPHNNRAVEHFWAQGPFAILPFTDDAQGHHRSAVVFTEHGPKARSLMRYSEDAFAQAVAQRFPDHYGTVRVIGSRQSWPLTFIHAARYTAPRMVLVADAAHGIHPVAAQGLNLGLRDVRMLADLIIQAQTRGKDIGGDDVLVPYETTRRVDNTAMAAATDAMVRIFSSRLPGIGMLRRAGLRLVQKTPVLKTAVTRWAMGL